jgi:O-acetyl-ADP-ribose deacetylase (regulator of RNase III)
MATFRPPRAKAALLPLADIPSLTTLYDQGKLSAIEAAAPAAWQPVYAPNPRLNARIALVRHDITRMQVDGIVNAANEALLGGGGVDGAIHRGAGGQLLDACLRLNGCKTGDAKITDGFNLPARKVIHTVGPVYYRMGDKKRAAELLRSCYRRSLEVGAQNGLKSLVFCPIATNIYGYPNEEAAEIAISEVRRYFQEGNGGNYNMVVFTNILDVDYEPYLDVLP